MRRTFALCVGLFFPAFASAEPIVVLGSYTPAAFAKATQDTDKAVLVHVVSKFCGQCEAQTVMVGQASESMPGVEAHVVGMTLPLETWMSSPVLERLGTKKAGTLVLVRGTEVLGSMSTADPMELMTLLTPILPVPPTPIDPNTGYPLDPATGMAVDPTTGQLIDPATGMPVE